MIWWLEFRRVLFRSNRASWVGKSFLLQERIYPPRMPCLNKMPCSTILSCFTSFIRSVNTKKWGRCAWAEISINRISDKKEIVHVRCFTCQNIYAKTIACEVSQVLILVKITRHFIVMFFSLFYCKFVKTICAKIWIFQNTCTCGILFIMVRLMIWSSNRSNYTQSALFLKPILMKKIESWYPNNDLEG